MTNVLDLADEDFVSLTTFRKSGAGVATAVWVVRDGDRVAVWTPRGSGKVKRLRNNSAVTVQKCDRRGRPTDGAPLVDAMATVHDDEATERRVVDLLRRKYGFQFRAVTLIEKVRPAMADRVIIEIAPG